MGLKIKDVEVSSLSPMMQHYVKTKNENKDCILFYRLGDFYEMFFEDAEAVSKELELTLTGKDCGLKERAPMCGVPFHAADIYINRLVERGYKVAICEQVEDPKTAKGMVKREVVRVVTPGTNLNTQALDETKNNYIMAIVYLSNRYGIAIADVTTGDFMVTEVEKSRTLLDEIYKFSPAEIICNESFYMSGVDLEELKNHYRSIITLLGEDAEREGLLKTPERVAKAMLSLTKGYHMDPHEVLRSAKFKEEYSQMVIVKDIDFFSLCEHHMLPFYGKAHVAYIPNGYITGLSKIARVVDIFSHRLQVQERMTLQIKECIQETLNPLGVMVVVEAKHMCMQMRGVEKQNSITTTSDFTGAFNQAKTREEFMNLINR